MKVNEEDAIASPKDESPNHSRISCETCNRETERQRQTIELLLKEHACATVDPTISPGMLQFCLILTMFYSINILLHSRRQPRRVEGAMAKMMFMLMSTNASYHSIETACCYKTSIENVRE